MGDQNLKIKTLTKQQLVVERQRATWQAGGLARGARNQVAFSSSLNSLDMEWDRLEGIVQKIEISEN